MIQDIPASAIVAPGVNVVSDLAQPHLARHGCSCAVSVAKPVVEKSAPEPVAPEVVSVANPVVEESIQEPVVPEVVSAPELVSEEPMPKPVAPKVAAVSETTVPQIANLERERISFDLCANQVRIFRARFQAAGFPKEQVQAVKQLIEDRPSHWCIRLEMLCDFLVRKGCDPELIYRMTSKAFEMLTPQERLAAGGKLSKNGQFIVFFLGFMRLHHLVKRGIVADTGRQVECLLNNSSKTITRKSCLPEDFTTALDTCIFSMCVPHCESLSQVNGELFVDQLFENLLVYHPHTCAIVLVKFATAVIEKKQWHIVLAIGKSPFHGAIQATKYIKKVDALAMAKLD